MNTIRLLRILFFLSTLISCEEKTFYTSSGNYDYCRLPLIYPFILLKLNYDDNWSIADSTTIKGFYPSNVIKFEVEYPFVYGIDGAFIERGRRLTYEQPTKWFILDCITKELSEFDEEMEFIENIERLDVKKTELMNTNEYYNKYLSKGELHWFPTDKKRFPSSGLRFP